MWLLLPSWLTNSPRRRRVGVLPPTRSTYSRVVPARRRTLAPPGSNEQILYLPAAGERVESVHISDAPSVRFELSAPIQSEITYKGRRSFCGEWCCATTHQHVPFRSWLHRDFLISADYCNDVVGMSAHPFMFWFDNARHGRRSHSPDYFLRLRDGRAVVVDVRADGHTSPDTHEASEAAAELCALTGWNYVRAGQPSRVQVANLRWLAGYSNHRNCNPRIAAEVLAHLKDVQSSNIGEVARAVGEPTRVLPTMYHLMWHQRVSVDPFTHILTLRSTIEVAHDAR